VYVLRIYCYIYRHIYVLLRDRLSTFNTQLAVWFIVWLCFPGMTSSLANHRCTLSYVFFYNILIFDVPQYSHIFHYIKDIRPAIYFDNQKIIAYHL